MTESKIINLVAVRMKSKRLPRKALLSICGKPLLWHLMDRVGRSKIPEKTVICTTNNYEDDELAEFAQKNGFEIFRGHADNLFLRFIVAAEQHHANHVVRITGDNPLTDPNLIDKMCQLHINDNAEYTFTSEPPRGTRPEVISVNALKRCNRLAENPNFSEYMTFYFKENYNIFKVSEYSYKDNEFYRPNYLVTVDTNEDLLVVKRIYDELYEKNKVFSIKEIISFLDTHPEIHHDRRKKSKSYLKYINTKLKLIQNKEPLYNSSYRPL